jgi:WD40 repeat protein
LLQQIDIFAIPLVEVAQNWRLPYTVMFTNQSTDVSLGAPCRTMDAIRTPGDATHNLWLAGTCDRRAPSLQVLQWHHDINEVVVHAVYDVPAPVKRIACNPENPQQVLVASEQQSSVVLYQMPAFEESPAVSGGGALPTLATLEPEASFGTPTVDVAWQPSSDDGPLQAVTVDRQGHAVLWDLATLQQQPSSPLPSDDGAGGPEPRVVWDPHSSPFCLARTVPTTRSNGVVLWDARASADTTTISGAAQQGILDLDYNPNRPHVLVTAGRNGTAQFWDLRQAAHPLATARGGHSHYAASVQYNPFHDQLVLTTGTDRVTNLWRMSSCSSAPLLMHSDGDGVGGMLLSKDEDDDGAAEPTRSTAEDRAVNARVQRYGDFGDSVYAAAWGAADAWVYMAISYDGKAVLQHVPSKEKYKILL